MKRIRRYLRSILAASLVAATSAAALAQGYPNKAIRLIVPFGAGGAADAIARPLAEKLGAELKQSVVVDNRPGGQTVIGGDAVAKSAPDGYTLYLMPGSHVLAPYLLKSVPYDVIADFTPIVTIGTQPYILVANSQQPYATLNEFVAFAKKQPEQISVGVSDAVTQGIATALQNAAQIKLNIIPYKSGAPANTDLLGNQIAAAVVTPNLMPQIKDGRLRALAVSSRERLPYLGEVPSVAETLPGSDFNIGTWYAVAAPAKLPPAIVEQLHAAISKIIANDGDIKRRLNDLGVVHPANNGPAATLSTMQAYKAQMGVLIQQIGITPQ